MLDCANITALHEISRCPEQSDRLVEVALQELASIKDDLSGISD